MTTTNTISILIAERCIEALDREEDGASVTIIGTVTNENIAIAAGLLFAGKHCYLAPAPGAANSDRISPEAQASLIEKDALIAENSLQILSLSSTVAARNKVIAENESRIAHLESEATACRMTKADAPEDEGEIAELRALLIEMVKRASDPDLGRGVFGARLMLQQAIRDAEEKLGIAEADAPEFEPTETAGRLFVKASLAPKPVSLDPAIAASTPDAAVDALIGKPDVLASFVADYDAGRIDSPRDADRPARIVNPKCEGTNKSAGVPCTAEGKIQRGEKWFCGRCDPEKPSRAPKAKLALVPPESR